MGQLPHLPLARRIPTLLFIDSAAPRFVTQTSDAGGDAALLVARKNKDGSGSGSGRIPAGFGSCGFGFGDDFLPMVFGFGFGFGIGFGFGFGFSPVDIQ
jgi:hypothetical protein